MEIKKDIEFFTINNILILIVGICIGLGIIRMKQQIEEKNKSLIILPLEMYTVREGDLLYVSKRTKDTTVIKICDYCDNIYDDVKLNFKKVTNEKIKETKERGQLLR